MNANEKKYNQITRVLVFCYTSFLVTNLALYVYFSLR